MSINKLYKQLEKNLSYENKDNNVVLNINGELMFNDGAIIWTYNLDKYFDDNLHNDEYVDEEEIEMFNFTSESNEEILQNIFQSDFEKIEIELDELTDIYDWDITDPKIVDDVIFFKIF